MAPPTSELLAALARALGLPSLKLDETDTCAVLFAGDLHVDLHFVEDHDALCLCLEVGQLTLADKPTALRRLLEANLTREGLGHSHLALSESGDIVALCRTLPLEGQRAVTLLDELAGLVRACREWRQSLGLRQSSSLV
jgi:hypothetical protein